jgi:hypothetical protein
MGSFKIILYISDVARGKSKHIKYIYVCSSDLDKVKVPPPAATCSPFVPPGSGCVGAAVEN